jgi:hypothetical protein
MTDDLLEGASLAPPTPCCAKTTGGPSSLDRLIIQR